MGLIAILATEHLTINEVDEILRGGVRSPRIGYRDSSEGLEPRRSPQDCSVTSSPNDHFGCSNVCRRGDRRSGILRSGANMPNPGKSLRIFLAHSSQDKPIVRDICNLLRADGFSPWLDEDELVPGHNLELEIGRAVGGSDVVAVFLSRNSVDRAGYVHKEVSLAIDLAERQPERSIFIVPIRLDDCEVPERLGHLVWLQITERGFTIGRFYRSLQRALVARARQVDLANAPEDEVGSTEPSPTPKTGLGGSKGGGFSGPIESYLGRYLVRGKNPDGAMYYGTATIDHQADRGYRLIGHVGGQDLMYEGTRDGSGLLFRGPHSVTYFAGEAKGILIGEWGEGGFEELIPASPFADFDATGSSSR